jgi:hypothetical protein
MKNIKVLVAGDSLIDHHIYKGNLLFPSNTDESGTTIKSSYGGCFLLGDIINQIFKSDDAIQILNQLPKPSDQHAYAVWGANNNTWRVSNKLGYGPKPLYFSHTRKIKRVWDKKELCDIAVFDDAAMKFRFDHMLWPSFIEKKENTPKWILTKMSYPMVKGDFWESLQEAGFKDKLVLVISADDLRRGEVKISKGISWERTIQDVLKELKTNASLKELRDCKHLIINFGNEGALWLNLDDSFENSKGTIIFDPGCIEGEWGEDISGEMIGSSSCFAAGVATTLINHVGSRTNSSKESVGFIKGISSGLIAVRALFEKGHGNINNKVPGFPFENIACTINTNHSNVYRSVRLPNSVFEDSDDKWSLIDRNTADNPGPLYGRARQLALYGPGILKDIPYGAFGKLYTLDRSEIESLNGIKLLINDYVEKAKQEKPLCIGVFGPPGSGKSFGVKQIAMGILGEEVPILEFNLSQFSDPKMIIDALHQVRDEILKGETPIVFWDEFDSKELIWLQYLLAPMQDGEFLEGQISHPLGKCVFVFAGGISYTMENFAPIDNKSETLIENEENKKEIKEFKLKKGPDFISRLHGYLNVLGPNCRQKYNYKTGKWEDDSTDKCFPLRRALLLRVKSGIDDKNKKLEIDFGLLNAFIKIDKYNHGARSMETIIKLTRKNNSAGLFRSSLPPKEQIAIHINFENFMALIEQDNVFKVKSIPFAIDIHKSYNKMTKGEHVSYDMIYKKLPPNIKSDNIQAAIRIPDILSLISLQIENKKDTVLKEIDDRVLDELLEENIDILAEAEHDLWMREKKLNGWRFVEKPEDRKDAKKLHNCLKPYQKLGPLDQKKDKDAVRNYVSIVKKAGFILVYENQLKNKTNEKP